MRAIPENPSLAWENEPVRVEMPSVTLALAVPTFTGPIDRLASP